MKKPATIMVVGFCYLLVKNYEMGFGVYRLKNYPNFMKYARLNKYVVTSAVCWQVMEIDYVMVYLGRYLQSTSMVRRVRC